MSSKARKKTEQPEKDSVNIRRLVHDVMTYTLQKCGLPETCLPPIQDPENVYNRTNFLEIAGVCTLRVSLAMRDRWRRMFFSRQNSSGFKNEDIYVFLEKVALCCPLSYSNTTQSIVNTTFALCNELFMFFHHEVVNIDLGMVISSTSKYVTFVIRMNPHIYVNIEDLFDKFEHLSAYSEWITDFITHCATPYGASEEVSKVFFEHVQTQWTMLKSSFPRKLSTRERRDYLGFLPDYLFEIIEANDSEDLEILASESMISSDHESLEPPAQFSSPERGAVGGSELGEKRSSKHVAQDDQDSSEVAIEDELGRLSLGAEGTSQENRRQRKRSKKKSGKKK